MSLNNNYSKKLSKLRAVNLILREGGGKRPTSSLGEGSTLEAQKALRILEDETTNLLAKGYSFNTSFNVLLKKSTDGEVFVPDNILEIVPQGSNYFDSLEVRGNKLWNRDGGTFQIGKDITCSTYDLLPFEDLPQQARWFIALISTIKYANSFNPGNSSINVTSRDLADAQHELERYDSRKRRFNRRTSNPHFARIRGGNR